LAAPLNEAASPVVPGDAASRVPGRPALAR
jgi:hypothetical protein